MDGHTLVSWFLDRPVWPDMNQHLGEHTRIEIELSEYSSRTYSLGTPSTSTWLIIMTHRYSAWRVLGSTMIETFLGPRSKIQFPNVNIQLEIKNSKLWFGFGSGKPIYIQWNNESLLKLIQWNIQKCISYWFSRQFPWF